MPPKAAGKADAKAKAKGKAKAKVEEEEENKMPQPDKAVFEEQLAVIQKTIEDFQAEQAALAAKIQERSGGKDEYFAKRNEFRAQLDEFTTQIDALMAKKGELNQGISDKKQEGATMRNELSKMKKSIGFTSEAAIDDRIADIELWLRTESFTLKQEKEYLKEISELKKNRPKVGKMHQMEDSLHNRDTGASLRDNIGTINEQIALYREGKKQVSQALNELNTNRKEQSGDLPNLFAERDEIGKKIKAEMDKRNALRDDFRAKEREYNNWRNEQRKAKQEVWNQQRAAQQAEWDQQRRMKKAEELDNQPYVAEITLIEQTILFCKGLVQDKGPVQKEEKKETAHANPDGTEILLSKESREEEFYFAPTAAKKKSKSKSKGGATEGKAKPIKHNAETFKLFDQLKLSAPITTAEIPETLEKLEAQLESYQEKVKAWEKNRDQKKAAILAGEDVEEEAKEEEKEAKEEEKGEDEAKEEEQ